MRLLSIDSQVIFHSTIIGFFSMTNLTEISGITKSIEQGSKNSTLWVLWRASLAMIQPRPNSSENIRFSEKIKRGQFSWSVNKVMTAVNRNALLKKGIWNKNVHICTITMGTCLIYMIRIFIYWLIYKFFCLSTLFSKVNFSYFGFKVSLGYVRGRVLVNGDKYSTRKSNWPVVHLP